MSEKSQETNPLMESQTQGTNPEPVSEINETVETKVNNDDATETATDAVMENVEEKVVETTPVEVVAESTAEVVVEVDTKSDQDKDTLKELQDTPLTLPENLDVLSRNELVEFLEESVNEEDINKIKTAVARIKVAFLKKSKEEKRQNLEKFVAEGGDEADFVYQDDESAMRFNVAFGKYKENRTRYIAELEQQKQKNLEAKHALLEELRVLINSEETLKKTYDEFKNLQNSWRKTGMVPKSEVNNLWQSYHFLVEKFFDKVKINKELKDLDLKKNLEAKMELCEKAEELLLETSITKSFKQLQKYHDDWKEIGPAPLDKKDEIWERFKNATEKINERRREFYKKLQEDQDHNYNAKMALCDQADELMGQEIESLKDWQDSTTRINELFKIWKSIGPAPRKFNDQVWERFKETLDSFFNAKKEYFGKVKDQQVNNYNLKLDLCVQAEALMSNTDWRKTTQDLIDLQKEWKNLGPVPRKHSNKIWRRFRAACDEFFERKAEYFSNVHKHEEENLKLKNELISKVTEYEFTDNKSENLRIIKDLQREWMEIGHVPIREKDSVQNDFRKAINNHLDKLRINSAEITTLNYRSKFESMRNAPDSGRVLGRERGVLVNKVTKLREDLNLWENNIGFLAESKNATILKKEFEKKINKARQDMALLEAKIKILDES